LGRNVEVGLLGGEHEGGIFEATMDAKSKHSVEGVEKPKLPGARHVKIAKRKNRERGDAG
jgi:hypothetical protein